MVSVIIPTYNRYSFLRNAIQSVFDQSESCDELVVVDDGSTDGTRKLVQELVVQAPVPLRYVFQENRGAAAARNIGIEQSTGDLLCFLDSDDCFVPEKIAVQKQCLCESGCLVSHTGERWLRRGKHLNQKRKHHPPDANIFADCLRMCVVGMSTVMVRKEVFTKYGLFDETLPCCEDYDFWLRVSAGERFILVPRPLTVKNGGRDDQLSVIHRVGMDRYRIRAMINLLEKRSLSGEHYRMTVSELRRKCEIYGNGCLKHGRLEEGRYYLQLPANYPF